MKKLLVLFILLAVVAVVAGCVQKGTDTGVSVTDNVAPEPAVEEVEELVDENAVEDVDLEAFDTEDDLGDII
jgi:hypothetical protein